jgi:sirohydrochlorin cobaltochelatase
MSGLLESSAYFLVAHGSRDPRSRQALEACVLLVREQLTLSQSLAQPWPVVGAGVLEFGDRPLSVQIATFAKTVARDGIRQVFVLPLFLMSGNHVNQDLPEAVQQATEQIPDGIQLNLCSHLGSHIEMPRLIRDRMDQNPCEHWILLAHGTRRLNGHQSIEDLAAQLGATVAYWATEPTLETQLQTFAGTLPQSIGIAPYFLFTGSIIDAIRDEIDRLGSRFTALNLQLIQPLNPSVLLAQFLLDRCGSGCNVSAVRHTIS